MNEKQQLKKSLGFGLNDFLIINLSQDESLIRLTPYLEKNIKIVTFKTKAIENLVEDYKLENRIYFLEDNENYFKISDLGVITDSSYEEDLKKAILLQIPLLAFNCENSKRFIKNDVTGYFVNDLNEMMNMIHFLKNNQKYNHNLGMNGYYFFEKQLNNTMVQI